MGANLAHFLVYVFNTDRLEMTAAHRSIELTGSFDVRAKALDVIPLSQLASTVPGWKPGDHLVYIACVPLAIDPIGFSPTHSELSVEVDVKSNTLDGVDIPMFHVADSVKGCVSHYVPREFTSIQD